MTLAIARTRTLGTGRFGSQVDSGSRGCSQIPRSGLVERQFLCDRCKQFSHVGRGLGGSFEKEEAGFACVGLGVRGGNRPLVGAFCNQIKLVACQGDHNVLICLTLEFLHPGLCLIQR